MADSTSPDPTPAPGASGAPDVDHRLSPGTRRVVTLNRALNQRTHLFEVCAVAGLPAVIAAILTKRPELLALGAPFIVAIALSIATRFRPDITVEVWSPRRITEGDETSIDVIVDCPSGVARLEVELDVPDRLEPTDGSRTVTHLPAGSTVRLRFPYDATMWGVVRLGELKIRATDRFGLFGGRMSYSLEDVVRVGLPMDRRSRATLDADRFRRIVGSHLSNDRGDGLEIADIRPWQPGDPMKQINWRISNRRQEPWVTLRHPDRSTTVVIIVDAHDEEADESRETQRRTVSAAMTLARSHLDQHDRVGLLIVGHTLSWIPPQLGRNQLWRIADSLVSVSNVPAASLRMYRPRAVRSIPSNAVVAVLSPLQDPLMVNLVAELLSRGNPVSILRPPLQAPGRTPVIPRRRRDRQAERLAELEERIGLTSLRDRGAAVVDWPEGESVELALRAMRQLRRSMARAR